VVRSTVFFDIAREGESRREYDAWVAVRRRGHDASDSHEARERFMRDRICVCEL